MVKKTAVPKRKGRAKKSDKPVNTKAWEVKESGGKIIARLKERVDPTPEQVDVMMASDKTADVKDQANKVVDEILAAEKRLEELRKDKKPQKFQVPISYIDKKNKTAKAEHDLYVVWAMEHLQDLDEFRRKLSKYSRFTVDNSLRVIVKEMQRLLTEEPAYLEAAARLFVCQSVEYKGDHDLFVEGELQALEWQHLIK